MKILIASLVVICAIGFSECISKEERMQMFLKIAKECMAKEGATQTDLDELIDRKSTTGKGGNCIKACLAETVGMMKNNQVDIEGISHVAAMAFDGNASKMKTALDIANECAEITDDDRCEAAAKIFNCGHNAALSKNLSFEDME